MSSAANYLTSLLDPFDTTILQPKLLDGKVPRSSGIRLRSTGEIQCDSAGVTYIALLPGLQNVLSWKVGSATSVTPPKYNGHISVDTDRAQVKKIRLVGAALRLTLVNSALENEGYFEAARLPVGDADLMLNADGTLSTPILDTGLDLANHQTYMTGKCRDLHRYQFRLNTTNTDFPFGQLTEPPQLNELTTSNFDMILIKIHGRSDASSPSVIMFDAICNQEVVYVENTALSRLMGHSSKLNGFEKLVEMANYQQPAIQVS